MIDYWLAISVYPASDLRRDVPIRCGWSSRALVLERRFVWWAGFGQRRDTNPLRRGISGGTISRVCSIQSHDLAHDPLCLLRLRFQMGRLTSALRRPPLCDTVYESQVLQH